MKHKYKGYVIEPWYKQDSDRVDYFEARPMRYDELQIIRNKFITRPWHGTECDCEICTYTEEDIAHNHKVREQEKIIVGEIKSATFQKSTLKECKQEIDKKEIA